MMNSRWLMLGLLTLGLAGAAAAQDGGRAREERPSLTVSGNGEVRVAPDVATVRLGITQQDATARNAQAKVNEIAQKILDAVKEAGIDAKQIQTSQLTLELLYAPQKPGEETQPPKIVGYRASNVVTVRVERLALTGPVIDAGLKAGANRLDGLHFGLRNDEAARREALTAAAKEAAAKAQTLATALGVTLVQIVNVQETGGYAPQPFAERAMMARGDAGTPVAPGEVGVMASVTLRYEIRGK